MRENSLTRNVSAESPKVGSLEWFLKLDMPEYMNFMSHLRSKVSVLEPFTKIKFKEAEGLLIESQIRKSIDLLMDVPAAPANLRGNVYTTKKLFRPAQQFQTTTKEEASLLSDWWKLLFNDETSSRTNKSIVHILDAAANSKGNWDSLQATDKLTFHASRGYINAAAGIASTIRSLTGTYITVLNDYQPLRNSVPTSRIYKLELNTPQFKRINEMMLSVANLAGLANSGETTVEDEHFLQQVIQELLPAIATSATKLEGASYDVLHDAETNYVEQLQMIETRLREIIIAAHQRALRTVQVQTSFLESKLVPNQYQIEQKA